MPTPQSVVVVPCYNEAERLDEDAFLSFAERSTDCRLLFVDDGSTDRTLAALRALEASDEEHFSILALEENTGKAEAVRRGMLQAMKRNPAYIGFWDADLATPLSAIRGFSNLLEQRRDLEVVVGARVQLLGRKGVA